MTTRTTAIRNGRQGLGSMVAMTAASAVLVAASAVGITRWTDGSKSAIAPVTSTSSVGTESVAPRGGLAERYSEIERVQRAGESFSVTAMGGMAERYQELAVAVAAAPAASVTTMGGMAERYLELAQVIVTAPSVTVMGGMAEQFAEQQAAPIRAAARAARMGGMAELYGDQESGGAS